MTTITLCVMSQNSAERVIKSLASFISIVDNFYVMDVRSQDPNVVPTINKWFQDNGLNGKAERCQSSSRIAKIVESYICNRAKKIFPNASYLFYLGYPFLKLSIEDIKFNKDQLKNDVYSLMCIDNNNAKYRDIMLLKYNMNTIRNGSQALTYFSDSYVFSNAKKLNAWKLVYNE